MAHLYILHLQKIHKQTIQQRNLQIGDLELITDHLTARSQYPVARDIDVHPDNNGMVRNVTVRTANHKKLHPKQTCRTDL